MTYNNYSKLDIENFNQKDKRIAWLSIFSSLCTMYQEDAKKYGIGPDWLVSTANKFTDELFEKYPILEAKDLEKPQQPQLPISQEYPEDWKAMQDAKEKKLKEEGETNEPGDGYKQSKEI